MGSVCCPPSMNIMSTKWVHKGNAPATCGDLEDKYAQWGRCDLWRNYLMQDCCTGHRRRLKSVEEDHEQFIMGTIGVAALSVVLSVGVVACLVASWCGRARMEWQKSRGGDAQKVDPHA